MRTIAMILMLGIAGCSAPDVKPAPPPDKPVEPKPDDPKPKKPRPR